VPRPTLQARRVSRKAPDAEAFIEKLRNEATADVAGGSGNQNQGEVAAFVFMNEPSD
jgi:hypothetical protein